MLYSTNNTEIGMALQNLEEEQNLPNDPQLVGRLTQLVDTLHWKSVIDVLLKHKLFIDPMISKIITKYKKETPFIYDLVQEYFNSQCYSEKAFQWSLQYGRELIKKINPKFNQSMIEFIWKNGNIPSLYLDEENLTRWCQIGLKNYPKRAFLVKKTLLKLYPIVELKTSSFRDYTKYFECSKFSDLLVGQIHLHKLILDQISPTILEINLNNFLEKWGHFNCKLFFQLLYGLNIDKNLPILYKMGLELKIPNFDEYILNQITKMTLTENQVCDLFIINNSNIKTYLRHYGFKNYGSYNLETISLLLRN